MSLLKQSGVLPKTQSARTEKTKIVIVTLLVCALALVLRLPGADGRAFWIDELWRVNFVLDPDVFHRYWPKPDLYAAITSPLYVAINRLLAELGAISPHVLRLSSLLCGLLSVVLAACILRIVGASLLLCTGGALLFAVNADFIQYSNEFKPYMFEVLTHQLCLLAWLSLLMRDKPSPWQFTGFFLLLGLALTASPNVVFLLPALGLSLAYFGLRRPGTLPFIIGGFTVIGLFVLTLYFLLWSKGRDDGLMAYWVDSFYSPAAGSRLRYVAMKLLGLWDGAFTQARAPQPASFVIMALWLLLVLAGLLRNRFRLSPQALTLGIFYVMLVITLVALNMAGSWPLGKIRPNQFVYAHIILLLFITCALSPLHRLATGVGLIIIAWTLINTSHIRSDRLEELAAPVEQSDLVWAAFALPAGKAAQSIERSCKNQTHLVFFNPGMMQARDYFIRSDATHGAPASALSLPCVHLQSLPNAYAAPAQASAEINKALALKPDLIWFAHSHLDEQEVAALRSVATQYGHIVEEMRFHNAGYFLVSRQ